MSADIRADQVWQNSTLVENFLTGVRGGIPFASEQISLALRVLDRNLITFQPHQGQPAQGSQDAPSSVGELHIADLGCGDGVITQAVLNSYPHAQVTAIDFSEPMLEQAQQRLQPWSDRVRFVHADLYQANWQAELPPLNAVLSGYCIHHLPDSRKRSLYQEIHQHLKPGGCFLNIEHVASSTSWVEGLFDELLIDSLCLWHQQQGGQLSRSEVAQKYVHREDKAANILAPVETQCEWLREIGFEHVDCFFKVFELAVFGGVKL